MIILRNTFLHATASSTIMILKVATSVLGERVGEIVGERVGERVGE